MRASTLLLGLSSVAAVSACSAPTGSPTPGPPMLLPGAQSVYAQAGAREPAPATTTYPSTDSFTTTSDAPAPTASQMRARPISGGTLRILSDGNSAVAADSDRDQVYVVDLGAAKLRSTVVLAAGDEPGRVVEDGAGRVHVALRSGGAVATIDPVTGTLLARRALCAAPRGLAVDPMTQTLHVACAGGELVSIAADPTTQTPSRTLLLDRDLRDIVVKGDRLLVSTFRSAQVLVVAANGAMGARLVLPTDGLAGAPSVAWRMIEGPGNETFLLHQRNTLTAVGTSARAYGQGDPCSNVIVSSTVSVIPDDGSSITSRASLLGAVVAADAAFSPDGSKIAVVALGGGDGQAQVQFFDSVVTSSAQNAFSLMCPSVSVSSPLVIGSEQNVGPADRAGLPNPADYLPPNGQVVAVAYDRLGNVVVQSREPATLQILTQRVEPVVLSTDSRFDASQLLFHTATSAQIACVSCHPEGGEDGRVWIFHTLGAPPFSRRTQSLRGGIMNTAPFHWNGDESGLAAIMIDVFQGRMGGGQVDAAGVAALGRWLAQIPTIPVSHWSDEATVARGKTTFTSAGCTTCHSGADFTNNMNVDVGTGQAFQVPQLHGLGFRAPYMHDGCAPTLRDRFTPGACGGDARHGGVNALSSGQVSDLIAYLDTL